MDRTRTGRPHLFRAAGRLPAAVVVIGSCAFLTVSCATAAPIRSPLPLAAAVAVVDCDADSEEVKAGRIPDDFVPTIAYRCDQILTLATPGAEPPPPPPSPPHAYTGDLSSLVAALTRPDDPKWDGACAFLLKNAADIWLEDASGAIIRVAHPVDGCGQPKVEAVYDALEQLSAAP